MSKRFLLTTSYVIFALGLDLILDIYKILPIFKNGFDLRKFILWLIVPICITVSLKPQQEIQLSFKSMTSKDWMIISFISICAIGAMFVIPHFEVLNNYYINRDSFSDQHKIAFLKFNTWWIVSWAFGWELMIRLFWLNSFEESKRKIAYFLIPTTEIIYHYNKPWPEIIGVGALSLVLLFWTIKRKNLLPALITHLIIEFILILYLIF